MKRKYLIFSSVTYALRAMTVLKRRGIDSRLEKIKSTPSLSGCGYALSIDENVLGVAASLIAAKGVRIIDILDNKT